MDIGVPREIKAGEGRVALLPAQVKVLADAGHAVRVEAGAGAMSGATDEDYREAGATVLSEAAAIYADSVLIAKVKEVLADEYGFLRPDHVIFTNLHTALNRALTDRLLEIGLTGFSAEETHAHGSPNSALAGEIGAFEGVRLCFAPHGGSGRHFMPHYGAPAIRALVLGLGGVGRGALRTLTRLGCSVVGLDLDAGARFAADLAFDGGDFETADIAALPALLPRADLVVNCVLWPKHREDHLIGRDMLAGMKPGAVIADISCDTAGAVETTRPTNWADPVYEVDGIRHFCVDNIPGAVPVTASAGYAKAILPFLSLIAEIGPLEACGREAWLARGLTCAGGTLTLEETGRLQNRPWTAVPELLRQAD